MFLSVFLQVKLINFIVFVLRKYSEKINYAILIEENFLINLVMETFLNHIEINSVTTVT